MTSAIVPNDSNWSLTPRLQRGMPYDLRSDLEQKSFDRLFESHLDLVEARPSSSAHSSPPRARATSSAAIGTAAPSSGDRWPRPLPVAQAERELLVASTSEPEAIAREGKAMPGVLPASSSRGTEGAARVESGGPSSVRVRAAAAAPQRDAVHVIPSHGEAVEVYVRSIQPLPKTGQATWIDQIRMVLRSFGLKLGKLFLNGRSLESAIRDRS